jgi:pfkB family carbohydrate kinase
MMFRVNNSLFNAIRDAEQLHAAFDSIASDCFNAGLITGLLRGLDLPGAAALGCAAGALSTQAPGGTGNCPALATASALAGKATVREATVLAAGEMAG